MSHSSFPQEHLEARQYQYHYQYEHHQSQDSSQYQPTDPQSYYNYSYTHPDPNPNPNPNPFYNCDYYHPADPYAQYHPQNPPALHPPGVTPPPGPELTSYFPMPTSDLPRLESVALPPHMAPFSENFRIGQTPYRGGGRRGGRPFKGGRGHFGNFTPSPGGSAPSSSRGRGRSRGGGGGQSEPRAPAVPPQQPSRQAFCELCRVFCNSQKLLENHYTGKRHLKNLHISEGLQKTDKGDNKQEIPQMPHVGTEPDMAVLQPEIQNEGNQNPSSESEALTNDNGNGTAQVSADVVLNNSEVLETKQTSQFAVSGRGDKRKIKGGGAGSKFMKGNEGAKVPVPPLLCEVCNVKCDTQTVLNIHMSGKRHQANLNRALSKRGLPREAGAQQSYAAMPIAAENFNDFQIALAQLLMKCVHSQAQAPGLSVEALNGLTQLQQMDQNAIPAEMRAQIETLIAMCSPAGPAQATSNGPANKVPEISNEAAVKTDVNVPLDDSSVAPRENSGAQEQSKVEFPEAVQPEKPKNEESTQ